MTVGCIIQARMGSTRLPGKVLMEVIEGKPVLYYVINQLKYCKSFAKLIIATTTLHSEIILFKRQRFDYFLIKI